MKSHKLLFCVVILVAFALTGCAADLGNTAYDDKMRQIETEQERVAAHDEAQNGGGGTTTPPADVTRDKILTVRVNEFNKPTMRALASAFMSLYPNVDIKIESYKVPETPEKRNGIITELLSEPPDIFDASCVSTEKLVEDALFLELNELLDGPTGIDRGSYFDHVLRGCETNGKLYRLPIMFSYTAALLNKEYMSEIGVDASEQTALNFDQRMELYHQVASRHPDETIYVKLFYSLSSVFQDERAYNVETKVVAANTPQMRRRLLDAKQLPTMVTFTPENSYATTHMGTVNEDLFTPKEKYVYYEHMGFFLPYIYFLADHPRMKYSNPVHYLQDDGKIHFNSELSLSISQKCADQALAWEFVKFCLESPQSIVDVNSSLPVNRIRFANQSRDILSQSYDDCITLKYIEPNPDPKKAAAEKEAAVTAAFSSFLAMAELPECESRGQNDSALFLSLIYPDLYLYHIDKQDVDKTLINIQNRLELYVNE